MDQYEQAPIPAPTSISKYIKYILAIFGIIALIVAITVGIYAIWFFYGKIQLSKAYEPTIVIPENVCSLPLNATAKYFSATIKTPDIEKTRQGVIDLAGRYNASVTVSSAASGQALKQPIPFFAPESYSPGYVNLTIYVPFEKAEAFVTEVRKIALKPNQLSNEYNQTDLVTILNQECNTTTESLKNLQSKEKIYLNELNSRANYTDFKTLIDELTQTRSDAQYQLDHIKDLKENKINKFGINLTIEEVPAG